MIFAGVEKPRQACYNRTMEDNETIVELRTKLEMRTWFLRASLALNVALISGMVVNILMRLN